MVVRPKDKVRKLKQRRNGFLSSLTKVINRAEMYFTEAPILKEVGILKENLESALFKLQSNTATLTSVEDKKKCYELFNKNKETANIKINKLENYLDQVGAEMQSVISDYAFEHLCNAQLTTGRSV